MSKIEEINREMEFSAAHVLLGHDKCGRLHGHNYKGVVTIKGPKADDGMIYDFNLITKIIEMYDHMVILPETPEPIPVQDDITKPILLEWGRYRFPKEDVIIIKMKHTTVENIALSIIHDLVGYGIESGYRVEEITMELCENDRSSVTVSAGKESE